MHIHTSVLLSCASTVLATTDILFTDPIKCLKAVVTELYEANPLEEMISKSLQILLLCTD